MVQNNSCKCCVVTCERKCFSHRCNLVLAEITRPRKDLKILLSSAANVQQSCLQGKLLGLDYDESKKKAGLARLVTVP